MSSRRFKTIILLMLVAANLCLLAVAVPVYWQRQQRRTALVNSLTALLEAQQVDFMPAALPEGQTLYELELSFSADAELTAVNQLMPGARADHSSPYQTTWVVGDSACTVEGSGAFYAQLAQPLETDPAVLLEAMGFPVAAMQRGVRTVTVWQEINGARLLLPLKLNLTGDGIGSLEGYFLLYEGTPLRTSLEASCSAADALVAFLASRDELGWVGSAVTALEQGYVPSQSPSVLRLKPVWRIHTDTATYEVDGLTRSVYLVE